MELSIQGPRSASELIEALGIKQPTFSRAVNIPCQELFRFGHGRRTRYSVMRPIEGVGSKFPLFEVSASGEIIPLGQMVAVKPRGFIWIDQSGSGSEYAGIPFYLADVTPQGFLGRSFVQRHSDLGFPARIQDWSEDQRFIALAVRGEDLPGNLLIGSESFDRFHRGPASLAHMTSESDRQFSYPNAAESVIEGEFTGSSVAGEQPKFLYSVEASAGIRKVLVKFSPRTESASGRRWGDLLRCENTALRLLRRSSIASAHTELVESQGRVFLEVTRFDRTGPRGRRGVVSLAAIDDERFGKRDSWSAAAQRLYEQKAIDEVTLRQILFLDAFGSLIGNTDRHFGNLSFYWKLGYEPLELAPVYDMLPMYFAPVGEAVPFRNFVAPSPRAETMSVWKRARDLACTFWSELAEDVEISTDFRQIARRASEVLSSPTPTHADPE